MLKERYSKRESMHLKRIFMIFFMVLCANFYIYGVSWIQIANIDFGNDENLMRSNRKCVIGARGAGFFSEFFMVINWLVYAKKYNLSPVVYWDQKSLYYQPHGYKGKSNAWEYYFKPVSNQVYEENDPVKRDYAFEWGINSFDARFVTKHRSFIKSIIDEYIQLQPWIQEKKDKFYNNYMQGRKTIGMHIRRTDKHYETALVPHESWIKAAKDIAQQFPGCQFLVATDEQKMLNFLKKYLPGRVIYYNAMRSENSEPIHYNNSNPARAGEDVLVEVLLLSECDFFIHGQSNVAIAVLFFNPNMPHIWLKAPGSSRSVQNFYESNAFIFSEEEECFFYYCWVF